MASSSMAGIEMSSSRALPDAVANILRCCYCGLYLSCRPIWCNAYGDGICGRCIPHGNNTSAIYRSFLYEKCMATTNFPCIYDTFGCIEKLPFDQVTVHENNCQFQQVICPSEVCSWEGPIRDLREHFKQHDLILKNNTFEVDTEQDLKDHNAILTVTEDVTVLLQYKYVSNKKILYFDAVHFCDNNSEIICNLKFVNKDDRSLYASFKVFNCKPYVSKYLDVESAQKIDFNKYVPLLAYPRVVITEVFCECKNVQLRPSSKESLQKIVCCRCCIYMVPPIVKIFDPCTGAYTKSSCKNCRRSSSPHEDLNDYCKELNYPCKWKHCHFVGKHYNIRQHEFTCNYATYKCPLYCDGHFNLHSFLKHLNEVHSAERFCNKITIALTSGGTLCYVLFSDQLLILKIAFSDSRSKINIIHIKRFNFVLNDDSYNIYYYFVHSHCGDVTERHCIKSAYHVNTWPMEIDVGSILKPSCFYKYTEGFSIVIDSIEQL